MPIVSVPAITEKLRFLRVALRYPTLLPLLVSVALSVALIERKRGMFTTGFLTTDALGWSELPFVILLLLVIDLTLLHSTTLTIAVLCRILRLRAATFFGLAFTSCILLVVILNVVEYHIAEYLGDFLDVRIAGGVGGNDAGTVAAVVITAVGGKLLACALIGLSTLIPIIVYCLARKRSACAFSVKRYVYGFLLLATASVLVQGYVSAVGETKVVLSLRRTCAYHLVGGAIAALTDFDGDGVGWLDTPSDHAPFDSRRFPFAIDIPNNGIDENGLGGDLTIAPAEDHNTWYPASEHFPDVFLVVPCSLRYDLLQDSGLGPCVMPTLRRLADEGILVEAYSHTGSTFTSLQILLCGDTVRRHSTLLDDFKRRGYTIGVFSVQDESFGNTKEICRLEEADFFFDGSAAPQDRVTFYSSAGSLILPASRVLLEVDKFLQRHERETPIFAFIHLETTHFPYSHDSPDTLVEHVSMAPSEIRSHRRDDVVALYRNAAANLDQRLADLVRMVRTRRNIGNTVFVIIGDHGEELFDNGLLGHGTRITDVQTKVPCIIWGGSGVVEEPIAHAEIRRLINRLETAADGRSLKKEKRAKSEPLFQWTGPLARPGAIALIGEQGRVVVNLGRRTYRLSDGTQGSIVDASVNHREKIRSVIQQWEVLNYLRASGN